MSEHTRKISVNITTELRKELVKMAARKSLEGKQTVPSDLVRKYIKHGIEQDKNEMK